MGWFIWINIIATVIFIVGLCLGADKKYDS